MADFLDEKRREITARLAELRPLVEEYRRLEQAAAALDAIAPAAILSRRPATRTRAKPAAVANADDTVGVRRRGRAPGSGNRRGEALEAVPATPGMTATEIAETLGVKQNYLYRVLNGLAGDGLLVKDGHG